MSGLNDHLKDVYSEPSPEPVDDTQEPPKVDDSLEPVEKPAPDDPDAAGGKEGRSIDEIRGELVRKLEKQDKELKNDLMSFQQNMSGMMEKLIANTSNKPAQSQEKSLEQMSSQELTTLRSQIPEENAAGRAQLEQMIVDRTISERVQSEVSRFKSQTIEERDRTSATSSALQKYPDLGDKSSDFYREVDEILTRRGEAWARTNPYAVLDAANEVASGRRHQLSKTNQVRKPGKPATKGNSEPADIKSNESLSDTEAKEIAARLADSIPGKKFDLDRIKERHAEYSEHKDLFLRG